MKSIKRSIRNNIRYKFTPVLKYSDPATSLGVYSQFFALLAQGKIKHDSIGTCLDICCALKPSGLATFDGFTGINLG